MMQLRELRVIGPSKPTALVQFKAGANVISGGSDTGKSYLFRCIDYALGASQMEGKPPEAEGYSHVLLELVNHKGKSLTLKRTFGSPKISFFFSPIHQITGKGVTVSSSGKGKKDDLTNVIFRFADLPSAHVRKNKAGDTERLTLRIFAPAFLVDEDTICASSSLITTKKGYRETSSHRVLSYMLTGSGDTEYSSPNHQIQRAQLAGKIELLTYLQKEKEPISRECTVQHSQETLDSMLMAMTKTVQRALQEQDRLKTKRAHTIKKQQKIENSLTGYNEMLRRYALLNDRYCSDLSRLDFIAEGHYFFDALQDEPCPLCNQLMTIECANHIAEKKSSSTLYEAARAEASKIRGLQRELNDTINSLNTEKNKHASKLRTIKKEMEHITLEMNEQCIPALTQAQQKLNETITQRILIESHTVRDEYITEFKSLSERYNEEKKITPAKISWAGLDINQKHILENNISSILKQWAWRGTANVTFDEKKFDIVVDGQQRSSHGKGVRAIFHAAFTIGLLRYCLHQKTPHPGFILLDSPLSPYKQGKDYPITEEERKLHEDKDIESAFWNSLTSLSKDSQIIILENKQPPENIITHLNYITFSLENPAPINRQGFIPIGE